ncbi:MAG: hypothetical protein K0S07_649 [Chlamydiales bacterium]|jgi:uncharacterized membrane protein|nr:hypothetical protein [Chlamydiales bacterium]
MKKYFLTGLALILPLLITILVTRFVVNLLTDPFDEAVRVMISHRLGSLTPFKETLVFYLSRLFILLAIIAGVLLTGLLFRWYFVRRLLKTGETLLRQIPLVNKIYNACSETIKTLFDDTHQGFKEVVFVPFPYRGVLALGLLTEHAASQEEDVVVFVPGTINPANGFLLRFQRQDIIHTAIEVEDALKYIVSCGILFPAVKFKEGLLPDKASEID